MSALLIIPLQKAESVRLFTCKRGTWAGFRPSWDRLVLPYFQIDFLTRHGGSTRGTVRGRIWFVLSLNNEWADATRSFDKNWRPLKFESDENMEVYIAFDFIQMHEYFSEMLCGVMNLLFNQRKFIIRITFWKLAIRSVEETTHCGWPTVSGRDIFISSHWGAAF